MDLLKLPCSRYYLISRPSLLLSPSLQSTLSFRSNKPLFLLRRSRRFNTPVRSISYLPTIFASLPTLDLTEDNVRQVLIDARSEFAQIFDASVGITGQAELAELDGPFVKISLKGRFWHKRSTVLDRLGNYLKQRIPEILEVDIEDEKQLDDSPENF
ncbi:PREDICTED: uncharacterized protein LOC104594327 [Nelumbo nucifera]|uniref:Uncharacterized protein LOC104594327 n=1 Tax=Nelumbo nucifera TaxID=4432 RepID=A0A1U7ZV43_NELNU|nr:PREDICTED: uncharacterized protein LOC104594327 [Nelumbo nucifera]XP_010252873.1 PREDICTED: uncharacterized protein LOC104594327 [Nelumbo nucifera]